MNEATLAHRWERLATQPEVLVTGWFSARNEHQSKSFDESCSPAYSLLGPVLYDLRELLKLHREKLHRLVFQFGQGTLLVSYQDGGVLYLLTRSQGSVSVNLWSLLESD